VNAIFDARRGRGFHPDGTIGDVLPPEHHEPHHLLTGILRCGHPGPDGSLCNTPLRVTRNKDVKSHLYSCPAKSAGGCGGVGRRGDLVDQFISEAVLAKLEERVMVKQDAEPWSGEADLARQREKLAKLRARWEGDQVSDDLFFASARQLEERIRQLRNEQAKHALATRRVTHAGDGGQSCALANEKRRNLGRPRTTGVVVLITPATAALPYCPAAGQGSSIAACLAR
jgi:Recombinase zinc beta ribbon domain